MAGNEPTKGRLAPRIGVRAYRSSRPAKASTTATSQRFNRVATGGRWAKGDSPAWVWGARPGAAARTAHDMRWGCGGPRPPRDGRTVPGTAPGTALSSARGRRFPTRDAARSEEHTSELQARDKL